MLITPLARTTPEGYQIVLFKFLIADPSRFFLEHCFKTLDMAAILNLHQNGTTPGHIILIDMKGFTLGHLTKLNPTYIMKFFFYLQVIHL